MSGAGLQALRGVCVLNKLRAKFSKGEEVKYISHLDTLRTFERAVRRAGIPIAYSHGFNPRPQMSFGLPLSVGVTSDAEYVDLELENEIPVKEFIQKLNNNLPKGFNVTDAEYFNSKESLMASIRAASYQIGTYTEDRRNMEEVKHCIEQFMDRDVIIIEKESKGNIKKVDIRPYIYEIKIIEFNENTVILSMTLSAGSIFNLKPEPVLKALSEFCQCNMSIRKIHRVGLFGQDIKSLMWSIKGAGPF